MLPTGQGGGASHQRGNLLRPSGRLACFPTPAGRLYGFPSGEARLSGFRRQRRHKKWRLWRRTSPVGTVSQPIGKPFNGQVKGLLWLTWRSYAGPPQYFIPPEGGALNLPVRRSRSQAEPLAPRAVRPGGAINPRPRKRASTFGNTASRRQCLKVPQSFAAALALRQSSTSFLPKSPCSCSNLATTGAVASCQRWISSFGIT